ncbi:MULTISPECIES: hypothetical protein [unclassified Knoellia]|uniref:hypothetical protein n=1 Tax=Knoellia altitudinis TaxID=3404795 RepID=UPI0036193DEC
MCTISGFQIGRTVADLETPNDLAESQEFLTDALGLGFEANQCRTATRTVKSQVAAGTLSDDLGRQL